MTIAQPSYSTQRGGAQLGFLIGLFIGIVVTGLISMMLTKTPIPLISSAPAESHSEPVSVINQPPNVPLGNTPTPITMQTPSSPVAPGTDLPSAPVANSSNNNGTIYYLQVGAYRVAEQADGLKSRLILLGFDTVIQAADLEGAPIYRVRVGPFNRLDDLNTTRNQLSAQQIEASVIRLNP